MYLHPVHRLKKINLLILALSHPTKRKIIDILSKERRLSVGELQERIQLTQPILSQNLAQLRRYKILKTVRMSKHIFYYLNQEHLKKIHAYIDKFVI